MALPSTTLGDHSKKLYVELMAALLYSFFRLIKRCFLEFDIVAYACKGPTPKAKAGGRCFQVPEYRVRP